MASLLAPRVLKARCSLFITSGASRQGRGLCAAAVAGATEQRSPLPCGPCLVVRVSPSICDHAMHVIRAGAGSFRHVEREDEGALRKLDNGLFGEGAPAVDGVPAPRRHMLKQGGKHYLEYRWDAKVVDERTHTTPLMRRIFGTGASGATENFRLVLEDATLRKDLEEALRPAALRVYGEHENASAHAHVFLTYATLSLPGQVINLHLDVPEFLGLDRSSCPNWLLATAHSSGLLGPQRVRNVTCVFYPQAAESGYLAVYPSIHSPGSSNGPAEAGAGGPTLVPVEAGLVCAMDADSCYHHSEQARPQGVQHEVAAPEFPNACRVEVTSTEDSDPTWVVRDVVTGVELARHPESDIRLSVSCKFHVSSGQAEADEYACGGTGEKLDGHKLVALLGEELRARGGLPPDCDPCSMPLHELGPRLVEAFVSPLAPAPWTIEQLWAQRFPELAQASASAGYHGGWHTAPVAILDGSTGRQLITNGMPDDELFSKFWSARALVDEAYHPLVVQTHRSYIDVGAMAITTNSYCVQPTIYRRNYPENWLQRMVEDAELAARLAVQAREESGKQGVRILGCLPPLSETHRPDRFEELLRSEGEDFCVRMYRLLAEALQRGGADAFLVETSNTWEEASCAVRGCQHLGHPITISLEGALRGTDLQPQTHLAPEMARRALELKSKGVPLECLGFNCTEPEVLLKCLKAIEASGNLSEQLRGAGIRLAAYANLHDRKAVHAKGFDITKSTKKVVLRTDLADDGFEGYLDFTRLFLQHGATVIGGCCGCGPEGISKMATRFAGFPKDGAVEAQSKPGSDEAVATAASPLRLGFIGGGAVGMYVGAFLARAGHKVTLIDGWPENVEKIRADGIYVEPPSSDAPFTQTENLRALHIHDTHLLEEGQEFDIGFVAVKGFDTKWATALIDQYVKPTSEGGFIVSAQNGCPDWDVAAVAGQDRVVGLVMSFFSVAAWQAGEVVRGGAVTMRSKGYTTFRPGELVPGTTPRVEALADMLDVIDQARATTDLTMERWTKLSLNCIMNAPQAVAGLGYQDVARLPGGRRTMILSASEACRVAAAQGLALGTVHGRPAEEWAAASDDEQAFQALDAYLTPSGPPPEQPPSAESWQARGTKSNWKVSMPQDVAKGRRTEVQFLNGLVAASGRRLGVTTPVNSELTALVERIGKKELLPSPANLETVAAAAAKAVKG